MKQLALLAVAVAAITALAVAPASAQANRTFVSGSGSDSSNCSFQNPCRTFAAALAVTNPKGEIAVLDPADYGTVTIGKAVSIVNDQVGVASITDTVSGIAAITINAGASDVVNLRGLTLTGAGTSNTLGIIFNSGGALNIQNCVIRGFSQGGISFRPQQSSTLTVLDTLVSDNGATGSGAIDIVPMSPGSIAVNVYLGRVQVSGNSGIGINAAAGGQLSGSFTMTVADSVATDNAEIGVIVTAGEAPAIMTLINTRLTNNQTGLAVSTGPTAYLAETVISGNSSHGFVNSGATIKTFGNNRITDTNNTGSLTAIAKQ